MDTYDLTIYKGATFALDIILKDSDEIPVDLTNSSVSGFLKYRYSDSNKLVNLNVTKVVPYTNGYITLLIPATGTAELPCATAFYDIETSLSGIVEKVLAGKAFIYPEVTY